LLPGHRAGYAPIEPVRNYVARQIPADEHDSGLAGLVGLPGALVIAFEQHVDTLNDISVVVVLKGDDPFHPQHVDSEALGHGLNPREKAFRQERRIAGKREACDVIVMVVIVEMFKEIGFELQHAVQVKGVAADYLVERHLAAFALSDDAFGLIRRIRASTSVSSCSLTRSI
jgi:hypothetical protein